MAQMIVRNIDDDVAERFRTKARAAGKSAEQLLRELIGSYAGQSKSDALEAIRRLRGGIGAVGRDPVDVIREDRDNDGPYR